MTASDRFLQQIQDIHRQLGIPAAFLEQCPMPLCEEPLELVDTELDFFQRPQRLVAAANAGWMAMKKAAASEAIELVLLSAYRSVDYQQQLIVRKLAAGQTIDNILKVNAAPGFSEHHTGRAVDLGTPGCEPLTEAFDTTLAFAWLQQRAGEFGFTLSYPRGNAWGIDYEPWHWCFKA
ncbi:MAG: hypothetical protein RLZZ385_922 [Pseudomonadota bacterium]